MADKNARLTPQRGMRLPSGAHRPVRSPWLDIPLAEYEGHMSLPSIGQAGMLADQLAALIAEYAPPSVAVIGCAGGNGFDRISPEKTSRLVGVDINPRYIAEASKRYAKCIPGLELYVGDIQVGVSFEPVDLVYAALIFEYVELEPTFQTLQSICKPNGILGVVLQLPSPSVAVVSPSPFTSLQALGPVMRLLPPKTLHTHAARVGFVLLSSRRVALASHKQFGVEVFRLARTPGGN